MFRKLNRHRRLAVIAICFVGLFVFSSFSPLDKCLETQVATPKIVKENHSPSAVDFSALWNRTYGGFDDDRFNDLTLCADGGFAFVGVTQSFDSVDEDIWVARTDEDGEVLWSTILNWNISEDVAQSIFQCDNGDFVLAGYTVGVGAANGLVVRIDSEGVLLWTYEIGLDAMTDRLFDILETDSGAILAVGSTQSWGAGSADVLVVSLSPGGTPVWTRTYGGVNDDLARTIVESKDGGYAVLADTMSYGLGSFDYWLLRLDGDGNLIWDETYGETGTDRCYDMIEYSAGGFVMVGLSRSFGDIMGDFYVVRADENGGFMWNETYSGAGEDFAASIVESSRGGFAISGVVNFQSGFDQARIVRIEPDGTQIWGASYGGPQVNYGYGIVEVHPEEFVVAGTTNSYGSGSYDGWVFLVPGRPELIDPPFEVHLEFGQGVAISLFAESTAPIHMWWLDDTSVFDIVKIGDNEGTVYRIMPPDVGYYEAYVHVNNTAGHETEHILWIYIEDTTAPYWTDYTAEHVLEFGDQFQYLPSANDLSLLGDWFLTGSTYFTIDTNSGEISNVGTPPAGEYNLEIQVNDMYHNSLIDSLQIIVQDTVAPQWDIVLEDQAIDYGADFLYDLEASDLAGIATWSLDNAEFSVDSEGRIRNLITLVPGVHTVTVTVEDVNGNILQGQFTVTVSSRPLTTPGLIDSVIPFIVGVGATLVVVAIACIMSRRKPTAK